MAQYAGMPVIILREGAERKQGKNAQKNNITAAKAIAEAVRSTLGPKGMDKMIVDSLGDVTITNDGAAILDEIEVEHPAAKMMKQVAKTQDEKVGDGTTTCIVIAGELLSLAEELMDQSVHPSIILKGYKKAQSKSIEFLKEFATKIQIDDIATLKRIAETSMNSKLITGARNHFAEMVVKAGTQIQEDRGDYRIVNLDFVQIIKKAGKSLLDTSLIDGIVVDKEIVQSMMPKITRDAKVILLDSSLEVQKTEFTAEVKIKTPGQINKFKDEEANLLKKRVDKIKAVGANVVFCQKGIDEKAQNFLYKENIIAIRRVKRSDMEKLARATGAKIVNNLFDADPNDLGKAGRVEEKKVGDDNMVFVSECPNPKAITIIVRAGIEHVVDEAERSIKDGLAVVKAALENPFILPGGGASEIELAKRLKTFARSCSGNEQLAVEVYANALEIIPKTLAENAGFNPVDVLVELRSKHESKDGVVYGLNIETGKSDNMMNLGVVEPLVVLSQAIQTASEVVSMMLKIDDVIAASKISSHAPPKMPKGAGDMED